MTPHDLIVLSLKQAGVLGTGQEPSAEDMNDCFALLNMMLGQWNRKRWLIYHLLDVPFGSTGQPSYTVGPFGDLKIPRPDRLEGGYARYVTNGKFASLADFNSDFNEDFGPAVPYTTDSQGIDYPLQLIESREDYAAIPFKTNGLFPQAIFYDPNFPVGTLYIYPIPSPQFEIHILVKDTIAQLPDLVTDINLPPEYLEAIYLNLAVRLFDAYQMAPRPTTIALARAALSTIAAENTQIPLLKMPDALQRRGAGYNVFSDSGD